MAEKDEVVESPDVHFEPIVKLPAVEVKNLEENEDEIDKMRAKLFRYDTGADPPEWKERGTGDVKFLKNKRSGQIRLLMRRDKTHKVCANHFLTPDIKLNPSAGSDRAWVYTVTADFADEEAKVEQLAIRFKNAEIANNFKAKFEECQEMNKSHASRDSSDKLADGLEKLNVEDSDVKEDSEVPSSSAEGRDESESKKASKPDDTANAALSNSSSAETENGPPNEKLEEESKSNSETNTC